MAMAISHLPAHFLLFCLYYFSMASIHVRLAGSLSFDLDFSRPSASFSDLIVRAGSASIGDSPPVVELTEAKPDQSKEHSTGRMSYVKKVPLWDKVTGEMANFTTNFSFEITPDPGSPSMTGDGMAFFLANFTADMPRSYGGNLGLLPFHDSTIVVDGDINFVAVEFDTFLNPQFNDPSGNHIGIDVSSLTSTASTDTTSPSNNLTSGHPMRARVSYDSATKFLAVDLMIGDAMYYVNATIDLSKHLPDEVAVGFSAATGDNIELHRILSWSFSSTLEPSAPAMGPAPTPHPLGPLLPQNPSKHKHPKIVPVLATTLPLFVCAAVGYLLWRLRRKRGSGERDELERGVTANGPRRYTYRELAAATNNFAEDVKLGQGGFGGVYRGHLTVVGEKEGQPVAIKMLSGDSLAQGRREFEAEVRIISQLTHRNLVDLLGWCDSREGLLLVYELVAEGTLEKHLHSGERLLTWPERYRIIIGLGSSLRYLHGECKRCVLHGDIKPSNIMLDSSYSTKLGDFGLARLVDHGADGHTTALLMGTEGYIDPAFINTSRRSRESDVYSFGIVLLEIVTGRRPVVGGGLNLGNVFLLLEWVQGLYGRDAILDAVDERLRGVDEDEEWWMERVLLVGLLCTQADQSERPSAATAMHFLQSTDARLPALLLTGQEDLAVAGSSAYSSDQPLIHSTA